MSSTHSPKIILVYLITYPKKIHFKPIESLLITIKKVPKNTSKPKLNHINSTLIYLNTNIKWHTSRWKPLTILQVELNYRDGFLVVSKFQRCKSGKSSSHKHI